MLLGFGGPAALPAEIELQILERRWPEAVEVRGACRIVTREGDGRSGPRRLDGARRLLAQGDRVRACGPRRRCVTVPRLTLVCDSPVVLAAPAAAPRAYGRRLEVEAHGGALALVAAIELEDYVAGVVASELSGGAPESSKALAIVVRTFTVGALLAARHPGGRLCDRTHCQLFRGLPPALDRREGPARATAGLVLVRPSPGDAANGGAASGDAVLGDARLGDAGLGDARLGDARASTGSVAAAFYHSSCGGRTRAAVAIWPSLRAPELVGVADLDAEGEAWCRRAAGFRWRLEVDDRTLGAALEDAARRPLDPATLSLAPLEPDGERWRITDRGGVAVVGIASLHPALAAALGPGRVRSTRFTVRRRGRGFRLDGEGLGHGVGLCLAGAEARARAGQSALEILRAYFPSLEVRRR